MVTTSPGLFLVSSLAVIMTPGPDTALLSHLVLCAGRRRTGLAAAAGMITGGVLHATLAIAGVAQLLRHHPAHFTVLRWLGALALLVWGAKMLWLIIRPPAPAGHPPARRQVAPYWQGLLCTAANPKVGLFLLAFLPQFVRPDVPAESAIALLAAVYLFLVLLWLVTLTELVYRARSRLERPGPLRTLQAFTAVLFIGFAVRTALGG